MIELLHRFSPFVVCFFADIAQLGELLTCNQWVASSSLAVGTMRKWRNW